MGLYSTLIVTRGCHLEGIPGIGNLFSECQKRWASTLKAATIMKFILKVKVEVRESWCENQNDDHNRQIIQGFCLASSPNCVTLCEYTVAKEVRQEPGQICLRWWLFQLHRR